MPFEITEKQIRDRIVAIIQSAAPMARVWNRFRISQNDAQFKAWYVQEDKNINVWFVRRVALRLTLTEFSDIQSETHIYELRYARGIVFDDSDLDEEASENIFQLQIEDVRAGIDSTKDLGLESCKISHSGLQILTPIAFGVAELGMSNAHLAICTLSVTIANPEFEEIDE